MPKHDQNHSPSHLWESNEAFLLVIELMMAGVCWLILQRAPYRQRPGSCEDLVSRETLKRKFRQAKKRWLKSRS